MSLADSWKVCEAALLRHQVNDIEHIICKSHIRTGIVAVGQKKDEAA